MKKAVVLLSGGLDSATTLAVAQRDGFRCHALSFAYGQRHAVELKAAERVAKSLGAAAHKTVSLDLSAIGGSALTDPAIPVPDHPTQGIPATYVPARNTVFLAVATGWAEVLDADRIFIGVNAVDYSGYPDCRPEFVAAFEQVANLGTKAGVEGRRLRIQAPLVNLSKGEIIRLGAGLGVDYSLTVSCYTADDAGRACGVCDSCRLRRQGFQEAGVPDPTVYR
ncbi:MAG TPA: 7-cyano-7-deazaguanine synthase QueC [Gammaproteobacteria bacterium]|nr:7-cyano-7-deazaguanine synthase QueC [Gammaproteobacteria bacterium]